MKGMDEVSQRGLILIFCFLAPFGAGVTLTVGNVHGYNENGTAPSPKGFIPLSIFKA
jgi:hypothetical protein